MKYTEKNIKVLKGLEPVQKRPAMFIGNTGTEGLHHLIWEIIDNSIDEALIGFCSEIIVILGTKNEITISDNGRGIPVGIHPETNLSTVETILTTLHAGGKFDSDAYKVSGGLHGVGASIVNALSKNFQVTVKRNNRIYYQEFENGGKKTCDLKEIGKTEETGTSIRFVPDFSYFEKNIFFEPDVIKRKLKESAFLNKNITITFINENTDEKINYHYDRGIEDYIDEILSKYGEDKILFPNSIVLSDTSEEIEYECVFNYVSSNYANITAFCNNIRNSQGGTHIEGFKASLSRLINLFCKKSELLPKKLELIGDDTRDGIVLIINLKCKNPQFEGQTKTRLGNLSVKSFVSKSIYKILFRYFEEHPKIIKSLCSYVITCAKAREAAKKAKQTVKNATSLRGSILPGKLSDCTSKNVNEKEIFIVEGDSAGGSAKLARNRYYQAILPLRGKIINSQKENIERTLLNEEIKSIISALGCRIEVENNVIISKDITKKRYERVIIMTDADVDGNHISILLLTFFINFFPELIYNGNIYLAMPPLFKIVLSNNVQKYFYNRDDLEDFFKTNTLKIKLQQRYKGLGEMNPKQLWDTTMNPETRKIIKVQITDFENTKSMFFELMGKDNANYRRAFIDRNSHLSIELDI